MFGVTRIFMFVEEMFLQQRVEVRHLAQIAQIAQTDLAVPCSCRLVVWLQTVSD